MCGIFAAWGLEDASNLTYLGLYALQHRGQESVGIVSRDGDRFFTKKKMRLVTDGFNPTTLKSLAGKHAIGHVRYSTTGDSASLNIQPLHVSLSDCEAAISHNGNLVNTKTLKEKLFASGAIFQSTADTEVMFHLMSRSSASSFFDRFLDGLKQVRGAYSFLMMVDKELFVARDPHGYRPLSIGRLGDGLCFSSETCAFDLIGASFERDVEPGEVIRITEDGKMESVFLDKPDRTAKCVFEQVYFARPDSKVFSESVYQVRKNMGRQLAKEHAVDADVVIPVPDSGIPAALGYAEESGIPFDLGLIRNHYVHRTFIEPDQNIRNFGVKVKLNPQNDLLRDKRVVVVDDSVVRGTTSKKIVHMLRECGAKAVHFRVSSPPIIGPCYFGIDTPSRGELIAANQTVEKIKDFLDVESLGYLSLKGMLGVLKQGANGYCTGCFTGKYPEAIDLLGGKTQIHASS